MSSQIIQPVASLNGSITVPGDKSISHRSLIFSALAEGQSKIRGLLLGEDVLCTMRILQQLGVKMSHRPEEIKTGDELLVEGVGLHGLRASQTLLDCGNSGTSLRLLMGLLSAQPFESILTGDASLNKRPVDRVMDPLKKMGANFEIREAGGRRLVVVKGNLQVKGGTTHSLPVASAQLKSAILLAGLFADGPTTVFEPAQSRDHTERMLLGLGAKIEKKDLSVTLTPPEKFTFLNIDVPADFSSAAFFMVAGLIVPNSEIRIQAVGMNPTRNALYDVLVKMGGAITLANERQISGEIVADVVVKSSKLKAIDLSGATIANLIDEIPVFAIAAACAEGVSRVSDAKELRVKESDRIQTICRELTQLGIKTEEFPEGFTVTGGGQFQSSQFDSHGDHRIAMSMSIAALLAKTPSTILNTDCINTSFPFFHQKLASLSR